MAAIKKPNRSTYFTAAWILFAKGSCAPDREADGGNRRSGARHEEGPHRQRDRACVPLSRPGRTRHDGFAECPARPRACSWPPLYRCGSTCSAFTGRAPARWSTERNRCVGSGAPGTPRTPTVGLTPALASETAVWHDGNLDWVGARRGRSNSGRSARCPACARTTSTRASPSGCRVRRRSPDYPRSCCGPPGRPTRRSRTGKPNTRRR